MIINCKKNILLIVFSVLILSSCALADNKAGFTKEDYPRVDGSTATIPLSESLAANLLSMSPEEAENFIKHNTTHNAYENLISGKADIIFVTEPSGEELSLADSNGIEPGLFLRPNTKVLTFSARHTPLYPFPKEV